MRSLVARALVFLTILAVLFVGVASAQTTSLINGDFETGDLSGWKTFTTPKGMAVTNVVLFDTNNNGFATFSAQFSVGQVKYEADVPRGGGIFQNVNLTTGDLTITADIAADFPFNFGNLYGGLFQLLVDGVVVDTHDFGEISGPATEHSTLTADLLIDTAGAHEIRFLIMRPATLSGVTNYLDNVVLSGSATGTVIELDIDIKPDSYPNNINLGSRGVVQVAVLTTDEFDASTADPATVQFADAYPLRWAKEDVDHDGDLDLIFHFKTQELDLDTDSTEATLTGETFDGMLIQGTDSVNIVP